MARIPREVVDAIRDRTDIVEVVQRHVQLRRLGNSHVGLCPFHQEKTPSFHVVPSKAMFHCFGCQKTGDVFKFLMEIEGVSFVDAVHALAGPAGITIEERQLTRAEQDALRERATLYDVLEEAASWFERQLWTGPEGKVARDYLDRRAISIELAREARLGWAPPGWTRLVDHLHQRGFRAALVAEAGLAKTREHGPGFYDAFRERVIVPIRDDRGRVIAFGGRLLEGDGPKYINSPETKLYQKSHVLYGLDAARRAVGQKERLILVEGYFDVLSMHQAGFRETVATCGTSLTPDHVTKIRRLTRSVVVLLDADEAGARAAERTLPMLEQAGVQAWRLQLPDAKDPDELVRERGPGAMEAALSAAEPLLRWVAERKVRAYGYTALGKERARDELAEMLGGLSPAHVVELAPVLRLDERELLAWAKAWRPRAAPAPAGESPPPEEDDRPAWSPTRDLVHLLWLLVHRYGEVADLVRAVDPTLFADHAPIRPVLARLLQGESVASVIDDEPDVGVRRTLAAVVARAELYAEGTGAWAVVQVLARLAKPLLQARIAALTQEALRLKHAGDDERRRVASASKAANHTARALDAAVASGDLEEAVALLSHLVTNDDEA
jgi:DNA primase